MTEFQLLEILYEAARSPIGLVVSTNDPEFLRQKLYPLRKTEPEFKNLAFVISPLNGSDLWVLNKPEPKRDPLEITI